MAAQIPESGAVRPVRASWRDWLRVAGLAVALLVISEALWLWQSWPVRDLLQAEPIPGSSPRP